MLESGNNRPICGAKVDAPNVLVTWKSYVSNKKRDYQCIYLNKLDLLKNMF